MASLMLIFFGLMHGFILRFASRSRLQAFEAVAF